MLQNPIKTLGLKKNMVYEIPPRGGGGGGKPYPASGLSLRFPLWIIDFIAWRYITFRRDFTHNKDIDTNWSASVLLTCNQ